MITRKQAKQLRTLLLKMVEDLPDESVASLPSFVVPWKVGVLYPEGKRVSRGWEVYKVKQEHTSQADWPPETAVSLYAKVLVPTDEYGEQTEIRDWEQPDSTNTYMKGNRVRFQGHIYESLFDNNSHSPSDWPQGWKLIE